MEEGLKFTETGLKCDNKDCNWVDRTILQKDYLEWIDKPCPKCGENVLTKEDYKSSLDLMSIVDFVNTLSGAELEEYNTMFNDLTEEERCGFIKLMNSAKMSDIEGILDGIDDGSFVMNIDTHKGINVTSVAPLVFKAVVFEKDSLGDWYIVLPEWAGDKADLQMVCGADTFLDIMAQGDDKYHTTISNSMFEGHKFIISKQNETPEIGGAMYLLVSTYEQNMEMWLCDVTRFVFNGEMPETIYFS